MRTLQKLIDRYKTCSGDGKKSRLLEDIVSFLPDPEGLAFLLQVAAGDSTEDDVPRLRALELLGKVPVESEQDRQRVISCLRGKIETGNFYERINALDAIARYLEDERVRSLLHDILLDLDEDVGLRRCAVVYLIRQPPTERTIEVCRQLLGDPDPRLAKNAELRLREWGQQ